MKGTFLAIILALTFTSTAPTRADAPKGGCGESSCKCSCWSDREHDTKDCLKQGGDGQQACIIEAERRWVRCTRACKDN